MAAAAVANSVAAVAPDTCSVLREGRRDAHVLADSATLKRWNGDAKALQHSTPSTSVLPRPASASALRDASAASHSGLRPGTLPTGDRAQPTMEARPRKG
jgi:hypothetical protein